MNASPRPALTGPALTGPALTGPTRRAVVGTALGAGVGLGATLTGTLVPAAWMPGAAAAPARPLSRDPFTLGVASGDPLPDGVVLWTRLAPEPLAADGLGGMPAREVAVRWEVATDERFRRVVRRGVARTGPDAGHSVHVEVQGLSPARPYWYRFAAERWVSPAGLTRTAPAYDSSPASLSMAFASCSQYEHGFFTAYRRLAEEQPELVLHLGDYLYEYTKDDYVVAPGNVRDHEGPETETLAGYRQRHAQYKTDADLQAAHAAAPWVVVWDDHEVDNNWADEVPEKPAVPQPGFLARRAAAFQAYYENMPLRRTSVPQGIDLQLYRRVQWGDLATFHMMDTRQYRDDQACGDGTAVDCQEALDPSRTLCGDAQERWLVEGLAASTTTWDLLGQQVFFARRDFTAGPTRSLSMDGWDGYAPARQRLVDALPADANTVVLTGDVHRHYANDVLADFDDPDSAVRAAELVCSSVTSGGDGSDTTAATDTQLRENPHIRFANSQRGYVMTEIGRDSLRADFKVLPYVRRPGAPVSTRQSFVVEAGRPGLQQA